jgi:hypothetical protein
MGIDAPCGLFLIAVCSLSGPMQYEVTGVSPASSVGRDSIVIAPLFAAEPGRAAGAVFGIQSSTLLADWLSVLLWHGAQNRPRLRRLLPAAVGTPSVERGRGVVREENRR